MIMNIKSFVCTAAEIFLNVWHVAQSSINSSWSVLCFASTLWSVSALHIKHEISVGVLHVLHYQSDFPHFQCCTLFSRCSILRCGDVDFELRFVSPQHLTPVFYTPVSGFLGPCEPFLIVQDAQKWLSGPPVSCVQLKDSLELLSSPHNPLTGCPTLILWHELFFHVIQVLFGEYFH